MDTYPSMRIVPMEEVLAAESVDSGWYGVPEDDGTVGSLMECKRRDKGYPALVESIRKWGLAKGYEPSYVPGLLQEGHHRVAALIELGARWCPINDDFDPWDSWIAPDGTAPAQSAH